MPNLQIRASDLYQTNKNDLFWKKNDQKRSGSKKFNGGEAARGGSGNFWKFSKSLYIPHPHHIVNDRSLTNRKSLSLRYLRLTKTGLFRQPRSNKGWIICSWQCPLVLTLDGMTVEVLHRVRSQARDRSYLQFSNSNPALTAASATFPCRSKTHLTLHKDNINLETFLLWIGPNSSYFIF